MFKLSRHWNKLAFFIINAGYWLIWDYAEKNTDILGMLDNEIDGCQEILSKVYKVIK